jgi:hypothetical protein
LQQEHKKKKIKDKDKERLKEAKKFLKESELQELCCGVNLAVPNQGVRYGKQPYRFWEDAEHARRPGPPNTSADIWFAESCQLAARCTTAAAASADADNLPAI